MILEFGYDRLAINGTLLKMKTWRSSGGINPLIIKPGTRWRCVVRGTFRILYYAKITSRRYRKQSVSSNDKFIIYSLFFSLAKLIRVPDNIKFILFVHPCQAPRLPKTICCWRNSYKNQWPVKL